MSREQTSTVRRVRTWLANLLLVVLVALVIGIIVITWSPWKDGAQDRIMASGLIPVLKLQIGQLGAWALSSSSADRALGMRRMELGFEAQATEAAALRESAALREAQRLATEAQVRERYVQVIRTTSALAPALRSACAEFTASPTLPSLEFAATRVAALELMPLAGESDSELGTAVRNLLTMMGRLQQSTGAEFRVEAGRVLTDLTAVELLIGESAALV